MATVRQYTQWWHSVLMACLIFYVSVIHVPSNFVAPWMAEVGFDKFVHFGMYLVLSLLLAYDGLTPLQLENRRIKIVRLMVLMPMVYGGVIELIQCFFTSNRSGSWMDWLADIAGCVVAYVIVRFWMSRRKNRVME